MPRIPHDAEHLFRLAALFAAGVVIFLVVRALMVPPGFGELGHFRPGSLGANQQKPLHFAGRVRGDLAVFRRDDCRQTLLITLEQIAEPH